MEKVAGSKHIDDAAKKRIEELANLSDSAIDTCDILEWTKDDSARAILFHSLFRAAHRPDWR